MQPIKVIDGRYVTIKPLTTNSVDIHLNEPSHYVNIVLPNNHILVVESDGTISHYDETETLIEEDYIQFL